MKALLAAATLLGIAAGAWSGPEYGPGTGFGYGFPGGEPYRLPESARETGVISNYEYRTLGRDASRMTGVTLTGYYTDFTYLPSGQYESRMEGRAESNESEVANALGYAARFGTGESAPMETMACDESYLDRAEGRAESSNTSIEEGGYTGPFPSRLVWQC